MATARVRQDTDTLEAVRFLSFDESVAQQRQRTMH